MLVLHELEEIIIGDITPYDNISKEEKIKMGKLAVSQVLDNLIKKEEYENLLDEFNSHKTNESKFAYECDKLEASLQAKLYDSGNYVDIFSKENEELINTDWNQNAIKNGARSLSDLFIEYDYQCYDKIFKSIVDNIK